MKVLTAQPYRFLAQDVLDPKQLEALNSYNQDAVDDVASKRWQDAVLPLSFIENMQTPYTASTSAEVRTYRFTCPVTCYVARAFLSANMTSSGEVQVTIASVASVTPQGANVPWLTTGAAAVASASVDTEDLAPERVLLIAGTEYRILVSSSLGFNLNRFDVMLHLKVDRWTSAGTTSVPSFSPALFKVGSAPNATVVAANKASLATEAAKFAANLTAPVPMLFVVHGIIGGGTPTDPDICTFTIPRSVSSRSQGKIVRMYLYAAMASTGGTTCTATLISDTGSTLQTVTANVAAVTQLSVDSGAVAHSLTAAPATTTSDTTKDYKIVLANQSGTVVARKLYVLVWVSR